MTLTLAPDIERTLTDALRAHADIIALNTRIRVTPPDDKSTSWVQVTVISARQVNHPDHLTEFMVQLNCVAGATGGVPEANTLQRTVRAVLGTLTPPASIVGIHRDQDTDMEPARDWVALTALIWAHP